MSLDLLAYLYEKLYFTGDIMLISFTLANWLSFKDETTFSMVASKERQHNKRSPKIKKLNARILPVAAIYGGNASGKSNFCDALLLALLRKMDL